MTKQELQKEIQEKVKPGVKPSDLKKLKRSKSADDIPNAPPLPPSTPLNRSKSQEPFADPKYPYTTLISQTQELEQLKKETETKSTTISLLRKKIVELESSLSSFDKERQELEKSNPPNLLLQEQLTEKQQQIENLRKQLEEKNTPAELTELDQSLFARHQNLKSWFSQYSKSKQLDKELEENIEQASTELTNQDQTISQLRTENSHLKRTNQSLQKDLDLAQRLAESRKIPFPHPESYPFLKYALYSLAVAVFTLWLTNNLKKYE